MEGVEGLVAPCPLGFSPHVQRQACADLGLRTYPVDLFLPRAIAPVAPLHRMRRRGQQRVIKPCQGLCPGGRKALRERLPQLGEPQKPPPPCGQLVQSGLGPAAPITPGVDLFHEGAQRAPLGEITGDAPQGLACGGVQVPLDAQRPMGEQTGALRFQPLCGAGRLLGRWRARAPLAPLRLLGCQALAGAGHGPSDGLGHLGHARQRTDVMRDLPEHLHAGRGRARRAIGGDPEEGQVACRQGHVQTPQKRPNVLVGGIVIQHLRAEALVAALIDRGEHAEGAVRACIGGHIPRKRRQGPVQDVGGHTRLRLFFPQPPPNAGSWHRGQTPGGPATGASWRDGRARHRRRPVAPPDRSHDGCTDSPVASDPTGPHSSK
jgi:hypothetical protein